MLRKLLVIGASVMTLMTGAFVEAGTVSGSGGYSSLGKCCIGTKCFPCSVRADRILKGLGNVNLNPTEFKVWLYLQNSSLWCQNKAGNATPANGQPYGQITVEAVDQIKSTEVSKNGKALSDITFHDRTQNGEIGMIEALIANNAVPGITNVDQLCPNANWQVYLLITQMQALGQLFTTNGLEDALGQQCYAPPGANAFDSFDFVGINGPGTSCDTLCWNSNKSFGICSNPPNFPIPLLP